MWPTRLVAVLLICLCIVTINNLMRRAVRGDGDLTVYRTASLELLQGRDPYSGGKMSYVYPPLFASLLTPLAVLGPRAFALAWGLVLMGCWCVALHLMRNLLGRRDAALDWTIDILPNLILFRWIWNGLGHGQIALILLVLALITFQYERRGNAGVAGFFLALAAGMKIFPLFLLLVFWRAGRYGGIVWTAAHLVLLQAIPIAEVGMDRYWSITRDGFLGRALPQIRADRLFSDNRSPISTVFLITGADSHTLLTIAWVVLLMIGVLLVGRLERSIQQEMTESLRLAFLMTTMVVVCPTVWPHYFTLLLFPFAACLHVAMNKRTSRRIRSRLIRIVLLSGLLLNADATVLVEDLGLRWLEYCPSVGLLVLWLGIWTTVKTNAIEVSP